MQRERDAEVRGLLTAALRLLDGEGDVMSNAGAQTPDPPEHLQAYAGRVPTILRVTFILLLVVCAFSLCVVSVLDAQTREERLEEIERLTYGRTRYNYLREMTYWGIAELTVRNYRGYSAGDVEALKLVRQRETFARPLPSEDLRAHFVKEFKRLFSSLPYHDLTEGYDASWKEFYHKHKEQFGTKGQELGDEWDALEEARRKSMYGGRAGVIRCEIAVKRRTFPVLYEIRCGMEADDDLRTHLEFAFSENYDRDLGYSSPEHISNELKRRLSEMLETLSVTWAKIRKHGKPLK